VFSILSSCVLIDVGTKAAPSIMHEYILTSKG